MCLASPSRLAASAAHSHQPPSPRKAGTKLSSSLSSQELGNGIGILTNRLCLCMLPVFPTAPLLPASPVPLSSVSLSRENRVGVAWLELVQVLPRSEGLNLCHPPRNETAGRLCGICRPQCLYKACGKQTLLNLDLQVSTPWIAWNRSKKAGFRKGRG